MSCYFWVFYAPMADSPHCRALKADSDQIGSTSDNSRKPVAIHGQGPVKVFRVVLGQKYRGSQTALFSATKTRERVKFTRWYTLI